MNLRDPNLPFNLTSFRALQDELRRMDAVQAPAPAHAEALADAYGELQALRNHVEHWRRSGIDDAAIKRADDALADRRVQAPAVGDGERINWLEREVNELRTVATDEDDFDWVVISNHMDKPHEREIGRGKSARAAIDDAMKTAGEGQP